MEDSKINGEKGKFSPAFVDIQTAEVVEPPPSMGRRILRIFRKNLLIFLLILALCLGVGIGAALRTVEPKFDYRQLMYLKFPGDLLMNMLKMLILPLIVSSLISGLASLDTRSSGKMGGLAVAYYLITTFAAVVLGIILVVSIGPGYKGGDAKRSGSSKIVNTADTFLDLLRQCFPDNLIEIAFLKPVTEQKEIPYEEETMTTAIMNSTMSTMTTAIMNSTMSTNTTTEMTTSNTTTTPAPKKYLPEVGKTSGMNVLGVVTFSIFFGIIVGRLGEKAKAMKDFFDALNEVTMKLVSLVIWYSPIGVLFLVAHKVVEMENPEQTFQQLLYYFLTVMAGLFAHGFITLPLIYFIFVRKNPLKFIAGVAQAIFTALGTSSSSATLPITMRCLEQNNGVDRRVTKFVAPVGATINMDGTALYEAVAVIFIGQMQGYDLSIGQIIIISITATTAAIGAAGVPQAGLVTMVIVLTAVGFPTEDVTLILAIDWLLDRFRTAINVLGDAFGAGIVAHLARNELKNMDNDIEFGDGQTNNGYISSTLDERL
ncbi:excitatory amino acid transporter 3-like [Haliotis rufescens]|uniref:excitatory amino acid transporter 3-like n=1 Tax=Haliotis rufescens TaxID=6454 RepID=UPI00201E7B60|nr:excitatory amino acid transporter 3-like [Haliotis rufescens]